MNPSSSLLICKVQGENLGFCYTIFGITKELSGEHETAMVYHNQALEVWQRLNKKSFILLSLKHILMIGEILNLEYKKLKDYHQLFETICNRDFRDISLDLLFKDFEKKLDVGKEVSLRSPRCRLILLDNDASEGA